MNTTDHIPHQILADYERDGVVRITRFLSDDEVSARAR